MASDQDVHVDQMLRDAKLLQKPRKGKDKGCTMRRILTADVQLCVDGEVGAKAVN